MILPNPKTTGDIEIAEINGSTYAIFPTRSSTNFRIMELEAGRNLLNITSNNTNPAYAKAGDKLTVHLTLDYFDHVRSANILEQSLSTNRDGNYLKLSRMYQTRISSTMPLFM